MKIVELPGSAPALVLHGGAGGRIPELDSPQSRAMFADGLRDAYLAGQQVLAGGGSALDAVCAAVRSMEDNPVFNAGKGAALTYEGTAECDASVMTGDGRAGAIAASDRVKNPVDLARVVRDHTPHVLLVRPGTELAAEHGLTLVDPDYFVTDARREQLARILAEREAPLKHGTVGAVALDANGQLAAATSTGGISKQLTGRVGDSPIIGAGTFAHHDTCAISCTGDGEAFLQGCVAHDIHARMAYGNATLAEAIDATFTAEVAPRHSTGGVVAIDSTGTVVLAHNSAMMLAACQNGSDVSVWT